MALAAVARQPARAGAAGGGTGAARGAGDLGRAALPRGDRAARDRDAACRRIPPRARPPARSGRRVRARCAACRVARWRTSGAMPRALRIERSATSPLRPGEARETAMEASLAQIVAGESGTAGDIVVVRRKAGDDPFVQAGGRRLQREPQWQARGLLVAGLRPDGASEWRIARVLAPRGEPRALWNLALQTLVLYLVVVGILAVLLRRITRPLAALTARVEAFARTARCGGTARARGPAGRPPPDRGAQRDGSAHRRDARREGRHARRDRARSQDALGGAAGADRERRGRCRARQDGSGHRGYRAHARRYPQPRAHRPRVRAARAHRSRRACRRSGRGIRGHGRTGHPGRGFARGCPGPRHLGQARPAQPGLECGPLWRRWPKSRCSKTAARRYCG